MRTRFLSKCTNDEVESYLTRNDTIIVPVGVTEIHGGLPLDVETVLPEAIALRMAEEADALVLHNLPYFYAGGTTIARGTVQVSNRTSSAYLLEIAESLLRQGFRRQIWTSFHGPSSVYIAPVIRDFFEKHKVPILYVDGIQVMSNDGSFAALMSAMGEGEDPLTDMFLGAYDILGRLEDVPLTTPETAHWATKPGSSTAFAQKLFATAYASESIAFYFGELTDHRPTANINTPEDRQERANRGRATIENLVGNLNVPELVATLLSLDEFTQAQMERYPSTRKLS